MQEIKNLTIKSWQIIMRPKKTNHDQGELLRNRLSNQLNPKHNLLALSKLIPWESLEKEFDGLHSTNALGGQPPKPVRLMIGLLILQYMHNLSDEAVVKTWVENPYWQSFCGYDFLQWELPIDPSSLTRWRDRLGKEGMERVLSITVSVAVNSGTITKKDLEVVTADTTVMPKNIEYPTDSKLLNKARVWLVRLAKQNNIELRQNYNRVSKYLMRKIGCYLHARQMKRARSAMRKLKTIVGRVKRDCERKIKGNSQYEKEFKAILVHTEHLLSRNRTDSKKLYSLHEPHVECIAKGKAHKKYEFGCKVALSITHRGKGIVTSSSALNGNRYDGHTLRDALVLSEKITGVKVKRTFVDRGYRNHQVEGTEVFISGQKRGVTAKIKKQIKRRQAIEPYIGHMKRECKLGLCRLQGIAGDQINALLAAAAYNLKLVMNHLELLYAQILWLILCLQTKQKSKIYQSM